MALEDLVARLERDAEARVAALEAEAQAGVEALRVEAARRSTAKRDEELASRRSARREVLRKELSAARQQARGAELSARHAFLDRIRARANALASSAAAEEALCRRLPGLLEEALHYTAGLRVQVMVPPALSARLQELVRGRADVQVTESPTAAPGIRVLALDGSVEVDNTLASRLDRAWPQLAIELLAEVER